MFKEEFKIEYVDSEIFGFGDNWCNIYGKTLQKPLQDSY
jgi:hypothetical protein